jgi:hypothetical protein
MILLNMIGNDPEPQLVAKANVHWTYFVSFPEVQNRKRLVRVARRQRFNSETGESTKPIRWKLVKE